MSSRLTEVSRDRPSLHPVSKDGAQGTLLVRMIKPNLIRSHNWHVQPSCQRSVRALRLSGALGIEGPWLLPQSCPRTFCACRGSFSAPRPFLRELFNPIELLALCQTLFGRLFHRLGGVLPPVHKPNPKTSKSFRIGTFRAAQIFQTATSIARAARARGNVPGSCNGLFSEEVSNRGPGVVSRPHLTLRTSFPLPIPGRPNGHREAPSLHLQLD
jgi:hypothetical protein